jgi:hypothetical protein
MTTDSLTLKDYRHAYTLIQSTDFDAAPKGKFLYHVIFELSADARAASQNTLLLKENNLKLLSVLAKSVSLPSYTSTIETVNQYNRKKKYQTKIEYKDVNASFYDDNRGVSRALLEMYSKYYFKEFTKDSHVNVQSRDKYSNQVYRYGLDNNKSDKFFEYIKIFQLSKQKWVCYTLVNPIISQWSHDELAYAEGNAIAENKITVGYEAVLYTSGQIKEGGEPAYFGDNWYDQEPGPKVNSNVTVERFDASSGPSINVLDQLFSAAGQITNPTIFSTTVPNLQSALRDIFIPKKDTNVVQNVQTPTLPPQKYDSAQMQQILTQNDDIAQSVVLQALGSGAYSPEWNSNNFQQYELGLTDDSQNVIKNDIIDKLATDIKLQKIANIVIESKTKT